MKFTTNIQIKNYKKLIANSSLFDEMYYKNQFESVPDGDVLEYFIVNGYNEIKNPSPFFDMKYYLDTNPDVKKAMINPLIHYIMYGKKEGRAAIPSEDDNESLYETWCRKHININYLHKNICDIRDMFIIFISGEFKGAWYIDKYTDAYKYVTEKRTWKWRFSSNPLLRMISKFTTTPIIYYVKYGMYRNQNPNQHFSTEYYMNNNEDLINGPTLTPFVHYLRYGKKENRKCNYDDGCYRTLKDIYVYNKKNKQYKTDITLTVITEDKNYKPLGNNVEVVEYSANIDKCIEKSHGTVIWINKSGKKLVYIDSILDMFKDEAIFAVILKKGKSNLDIVSSFDFVTKRDLYKNPLEYDEVIFRKPNIKAVLELTFNTIENFNASILKICAGAEIGIYATNNISFDKETSGYNPKNLIKILSEVLFDKYTISIQDCYKKYGLLRQKVLSKYSCKYFTEAYNPNKYIKHKPNILIAIYEFSHGGGEIMPIRLSNMLYKMGYTVTALIYSDNIEVPVRKMLMDSIPVIYTNDIDELAVYLDAFNIQVISSHHQAVQSLVCDTLEKYPRLKDKLVHIATSHGMYENFDDSTLEYLFNNTKLIENTYYWTYVAEKNTLPFKKFDVYDEDRFIKIPNGMERPCTKKIDLSEYGISKDSFTIAIVSRAIMEKGWLNAIAAVEKAREITKRDIHLLLIGNGEVYTKYRDDMENEFIHFLGFRNNPCDYLASVDLCMLPSYYVSESAPLCLIEAMMCGIPSIASDIGDVRSMLECDGKIAGSVFPLRDMMVDNNILANEIVKMVCDTDYYCLCAETARKKSAYFELANIACMYIDVFEKSAVPDDIDCYVVKAKKINTLLLTGEDKTGPVVNVIVPNYNHSAYLPMRLDSIFNQTYKNIYVLLMDDCSTDNSREILRDYHDRYIDRSVLLFNETNSGGVFYQWAKGIQNSNGEFCWIAESDDYCEPDFLENVLLAFDDPEVTLSYCQYGFVNGNNEENVNGFFNYVDAVDKNKWHNNYVNDSLSEVSFALAKKNTIPNASGAVFRNPGNMDLFDDPSWYKMKICGDWIFYLYLLQGKKLAYTVDTKSYFRFHSNNSSVKTYSSDVYYREHMLVAQCIRRIYAPNNNAIQDNYNIIRNFYFDNVKNGTDEAFSNLYSLNEVLKWEQNSAINVSKIKKQREKLISPDAAYKTVMINPIISATDDNKLSIEEKMQFVGANSGNMVFVDAVASQIRSVGEIWFNGPNYEKLRKQYKNVTGVIPSSNFIIKGSDNTINSMKRMYMQSEGNITMIGLGAQAYPPYNTPRRLVDALSAEAVNFFKMAAERCVSLGIRGEFTAECLELMGIRNYRIIGCPTCYKYLDGVFKTLKTPDLSKPIFNVTGKSRLETKILNLGMKANGIWLMQMMTELPQLMEGEIIDKALFEKSFPDLNISQEQLRNFMKSNAKLFFNMDKWNEYLIKENFTFSFGSRFHGNMSALRNGTPALWITHDSRTSELIDVLHLPSLHISKLENIKDAEELLKYCDYSEFYRYYEALTREYVAFLNENNIDNNFNI